MSLLFAGRRRKGHDLLSDAEPASPDLPDWLREIVVYGCHGGAGTSTLKTLMGASAWDIGAYRQVRTEIGTYGRPLAMVCRNSVNGSSRAVDAISFVNGLGIRPAVLVVISEGTGPEPREAAMRFRLAEPSVGGVVRFPYFAGLRYVDAAQAGEVDLPKKAHAALGRIRELCRADARARMDGHRNATVGAN